MSLLVKKNYFTLFFWFIFITTICSVYFIVNINFYIKKGIDLVGGSYITLNVCMDEAYQEILLESKKRIESDVLNQAIKITVLPNKLCLFYDSSDILKKALHEIKKLNLELSIIEKENLICISLSENIKELMIDNAININIQALRKRLDPFGAGELMIARQGNNIILEIPSVYDKDQVKRLIGSTANLQMKVVIDADVSKEKLEKKYADMLDSLLFIKDKNEKVWYAVSREAAVITGALLKKAHVAYNTGSGFGNEPVVSLEFNALGAKKFYKMTEKNINKQIAIIIDNEVITAPIVEAAMSDGKAFISSKGGFSVSYAQELASMLESGSFAVPVVYAQERIIAPLLGKKTIDQGLFSCLIGLILLFIFTVAYYKVSGLLAFLVLVYNLVFTLIGMTLIGATLTLSGIAGLVLTLGMAIDSSILLFERMKDELKQGKSFKDSFHIAFSDGLSVILDANITHFLVAIVLYYIGAGPLKGFATTMIIGIVSTLLTGILLLKGFFKYSLYALKYEKFSI